MEPKLNPVLKKMLSNPEIGMEFTKKILENSNKIEPLEITLEKFNAIIELIPIGYTGINNKDKSK